MRPRLFPKVVGWLEDQSLSQEKELKYAVDSFSNDDQMEPKLNGQIRVIQALFPVCRGEERSGLQT